MNEDDYDSVVSDMRLKNGLLFGIPVILDTDRDDITPGTKVPSPLQPDSFFLNTSPVHVFFSRCCSPTAVCPSPPWTSSPSGHQTSPSRRHTYHRMHPGDTTAGYRDVMCRPSAQALKCYRTSSLEHPGVSSAHLIASIAPIYRPLGAFCVLSRVVFVPRCTTFVLWLPDWV